MKLRPKFFVHILIFVIVIAILLQPSVLMGIQNLTPKEAYPNGSLLLTAPPQAEYPTDLRFCYGDTNSITVSVVFYNVDGNADWLSPAKSEFERAGITLTYVKYHYENATTQSYYDIEFENKLTTYRNGDNAMLVICFANLIPQPSDTYGHLAGYSRVQTHISIVFTEQLQKTSWAYYVGLHEIAHNLGYFPPPNGHSSNSNSIMYPSYSGTNNAFDSNDINILEELHGA